MAPSSSGSTGVQSPPRRLNAAWPSKRLIIPGQWRTTMNGQNVTRRPCGWLSAQSGLFYAWHSTTVSQTGLAEYDAKHEWREATEPKIAAPDRKRRPEGSQT